MIRPFAQKAIFIVAIIAIALGIIFLIIGELIKINAFTELGFIHFGFCCICFGIALAVSLWDTVSGFEGKFQIVLMSIGFLAGGIFLIAYRLPYFLESAQSYLAK